VKRFLRHHLVRLLSPWILLLTLGCVLFALNLLSRSMNDQERGEVELQVRQILALDTRLNLDVLRLRHRQLLGYDSISLSSRKIEHSLLFLDKTFAAVPLSNILRASHEAWDKKEQMLEDFKRQNTILSNSLYHFINLSRQVQTSGLGPTQLASVITRDVLIFVNEQQAEEIPKLQEELTHLDASSSAFGKNAVLAQLLAAHGRLIVNSHVPVYRLMQNISRSSFPANIEHAYNEYARIFSEKQLNAEKYRRAMASFSLLMVAAVVLIMLRLQQTARDLERSHVLVDNIANHLGEGILGFNGQGHVNFVNQRAEQLLGVEKKDLLGTEAFSLWPKGDAFASPFRANLQNSLPYEGEEWLQRANGERFPAFFLGGPLPKCDKEVNQGYVTSFRDVTEQRKSEARLRTTARVFDNLSEAITIADASGLIQSVNNAFTHITGYSEAEAIGRTPGQLLGSGLHDREFFKAMWRGILDNGQWQGEIINRRKNGETYPEWLSITAVRNDRGVVQQYIALFSDISERKQTEAYIHHLAYHDPLTGLANRLLFGDRLSNTLQQAHRTRRPLAVMMLDIDNFKSINESLGHHAGDALLSATSERVSRLLREGDTLARISGDEFSLLLPEITSHADAATLASRILQEFTLPFNLEGREIFVTVSVGIAVYPADGENEGVLLKNADIALYNAKSAGRAAFRFFLESDSANSLEQLELESELHYSAARDELRLYYQPQIDSRSGKLYGVEALVRWQHPTRGLLFPDKFIHIAENSDYISTLGFWCLRTACAQMVEWQKNGAPIERVAVNVSARQLRDHDFVDLVLDIVKETGISPKCLELELTESSMSDDPEYVFGVFSRLRSYGLRVAIDDFGTGYSSLSYLARYPVDVVKIDKSFVDHLCDEGHDTFSIIHAIINMARALDMETVAEGVETEAQRETLTELNCDLLQGYLYSRPVPPETLAELPFFSGATEKA
jgi:diguanylate cyclase (GGDEF)-like protein/PAS domain S-box-containing protein